MIHFFINNGFRTGVTVHTISEAAVSSKEASWIGYSGKDLINFSTATLDKSNTLISLNERISA
ncbi:hypothetical protein ES703_86206 [subsurface metagenome]